MRIGIIGDTHFGFAAGTERADDCYEQAKRAFAAALAEKPDLILLTGDVFDSAIPRQETLAKAAEILRLPSSENPFGVRADFSLPPGIPIVSIHGTHERRPKGMTNPLQVLANAGVLLYLQNKTFIFEKGGEKTAITGFGGVPEAYALDALRKVNPKPVPDCANILLFHQSVRPFVFAAENEGFTLADLPAGFDLYIDGHIHWAFAEKHPAGGDVIFSGSTIVTQARKNEAGVDKSVWIVDLAPAKNPEIRKINFPSFRKTLLIEEDNLAALERKLLEIPAEEPRPVVRVKFSGEEADFSSLYSQFSGKFIFSIEKPSPERPVQPVSIEAVRAGVERRAVEVLAKILGEKAPANLEELYSSLESGKKEKAREVLLGD
jgi:DNA repair exonuclease SbcCD nuclease subunit